MGLAGQWGGGGGGLRLRCGAVPLRCARAAAGVEARRVADALGGGLIGVRVIVLRVSGGVAWDPNLAIVDLFVSWGRLTAG